jgi:putative ABC transport system permease protein
MDPRVTYFDATEPMTERELYRVRGVDGVAWAVPLFKTVGRAKTESGIFQAIQLVGHDDGTLAGAPREFVAGSADDLRLPDAVVVDDVGYALLWPGEPVVTGKILEMNDRRAVVVGVCRSGLTFQTVPLVYTRYSNAVQYVGLERKRMAFVVAQPEPGVTPEEAARSIEAATGLKARSRAEFGRDTVRYYLAHTGIPVNFGTTIAMAFIVGAVVSGQTFYMFASENLRQFAALKAIGVTNARLVGMILLQAVVVGCLGLGIGGGLAAAFFEITSVTTPLLRGFTLTLPIYLLTAGCVLVIVVISSLLSIRRVLRVEPALVFRG